MRGTALDERLEDVTDLTEQAGAALVQIMVEITADGVVTEWEQGRLAVAVLAFGEACEEQRPVVREVAGTLRVIRTALKAGISSAWTQRRKAEHVRDMARTTKRAARAA